MLMVSVITAIIKVTPKRLFIQPSNMKIYEGKPGIVADVKRASHAQCKGCSLK